MQNSLRKKLRESFFGQWILPILIALPLSFTIEKAIYSLFAITLVQWVDFLIYIACYLLVHHIINYSSSKKKAAIHPATHWPVSGPINVVGNYGLFFVFFTTSMLSVLNPFLLVQQVRQVVGLASAFGRVSKNEQFFKNYKTKVNYQYPFTGEWLIFNGGYEPDTSHSWNQIAQRYAFDFVKADPETHSRHENKGYRLTDYYCYQQPICAAADGEVVAVYDKCSPAPLVGFGIADFLCSHIAGNHVVIKHADGEYGFYAHLVKHSISVKVGENVAQGQQIGNCGHTGMSSEPHLHFHLQDSADFFSAVGLPVEFNGLRRERGEFVRQ